MTLEIKPERKISEIQEQFNTTYPFLMLGFFVPGQNTRAGNSVAESEAILGARTVADCQKKAAAGKIDINSTMTVAELEKNFSEKFHLQALVFRKAGNHWLQTTMTNNWTLFKQNEHGREITNSSGHFTDLRN